MAALSSRARVKDNTHFSKRSLAHTFQEEKVKEGRVAVKVNGLERKKATKVQNYARVGSRGSGTDVRAAAPEANHSEHTTMIVPGCLLRTLRVSTGVEGNGEGKVVVEGQEVDAEDQKGDSRRGQTMNEMNSLSYRP